jgi:hypothetical protein
MVLKDLCIFKNPVIEFYRLSITDPQPQAPKEIAHVAAHSDQYRWCDYRWICVKPSWCDNRIRAGLAGRVCCPFKCVLRHVGSGRQGLMLLIGFFSPLPPAQNNSSRLRKAVQAAAGDNFLDRPVANH